MIESKMHKIGKKTQNPSFSLIQNILEPSKNHGPSTSHVPFPGPINPLPLKTWKKTAVNFR